MNKKKPTKAEVEKAALDFLQKNALKLRQEIPNLVGTEVEKGKIVLLVRGDLDTVPTLESDGITFNVSVKEAVEEAKVVGESEEAKKAAAANAKAERIRAQYPGMVSPDKVFNHESEVAIGPGAVTAKDPKAFAAWKERHGQTKENKEEK